MLSFCSSFVGLVKYLFKYSRSSAIEFLTLAIANSSDCLCSVDE